MLNFYLLTVEGVSYCRCSPAIVVVSPPSGSVQWERIDHCCHQIEGSSATVEAQWLDRTVGQNQILERHVIHNVFEAEEAEITKQRNEPHSRSVCVSVWEFYQRRPGHLWYPAVNSSKVDYKQANGQSPAQDGKKHHPAESRHMKIVGARDQNPHHHATHLRERRDESVLQTCNSWLKNNNLW